MISGIANTNGTAVLFDSAFAVSIAVHIFTGIFAIFIWHTVCQIVCVDMITVIADTHGRIVGLYCAFSFAAIDTVAWAGIIGNARCSIFICVISRVAEAFGRIVGLYGANAFAAVDITTGIGIVRHALGLILRRNVVPGITNANGAAVVFERTSTVASAIDIFAGTRSCGVRFTARQIAGIDMIAVITNTDGAVVCFDGANAVPAAGNGNTGIDAAHIGNARCQISGIEMISRLASADGLVVRRLYDARSMARTSDFGADFVNVDLRFAVIIAPRNKG